MTHEIIVMFALDLREVLQFCSLFWVQRDDAGAMVVE